MEDRRKNARTRGALIVLFGLVLVGIGASLHFGSLDLGSLTKSGNSEPVGSGWYYVPLGLGVLMILGGLLLAALNR